MGAVTFSDTATVSGDSRRGDDWHPPRLHPDGTNNNDGRTMSDDTIRDADLLVASLPKRIAAKIAVDVDTGCWLWTARLHSNGYGRTRWSGRDAYAHRVVYELLVGPIPAGLTIDHLCRVRRCVCPFHVEPVTGRVNTLRGVGVGALNAAKTHCISGHPFDDENTRILPTGSRACRTCKNDRQRGWRGRRRTA